jgi:hypothetical protein
MTCGACTIEIACVTHSVIRGGLGGGAGASSSSDPVGTDGWAARRTKSFGVEPVDLPTETSSTTAAASASAAVALRVALRRLPLRPAAAATSSSAAAPAAVAAAAADKVNWNAVVGRSFYFLVRSWGAPGAGTPHHLALKSKSGSGPGQPVFDHHAAAGQQLQTRLAACTIIFGTRD